MKKFKKDKKQMNSTLPADSAARLPDTQLPRSIANPKSESACKQAKNWVEQNKK
ncbi:MAG: hypothetical protein LBC83_03920 [Oscillospiraceae bacterium]|jgi:hypothetical protein|nr:hypothetical protein [Oscillospiraceae bacterium]